MNTQITQNSGLHNCSQQNSKINIGNLCINSKVAAAPLAGITDYVLRSLVREFSKDCLITTEMISSEGLNQREIAPIAYTDGNESPISFQISGHKPELMGKIASKLTPKADIIDINMGCPVNKIMKATDGCALMKSPQTAYDIVRAVKDSTDLPVTCKFRLGIKQEEINFVEFAVKMQDAGASAVCIHARTRVQMYSGNADWKRVAALKGEIDIPYFINGDITSVETAETALEDSKADGVSIGRAIIGNPRLPFEIDTYFKTGKKVTPLTMAEKLDLLRKHLDKEIEFRGENTGIKFFRKFYPYYIKGVQEACEYRRRLVTEENYGEILKTLDEIRDNI